MNCFVIMPYGKRKDTKSQVIDFDEIYIHLIKKSVEALDISCIRCDEIAKSGWIHSRMFEMIQQSEVAIVDISLLNPNVFYELGVRHALVPAVTVIIRRKGTELPFNIQGFHVIDYDQTSPASVAEAGKKIADFVRNGLELRNTDSPIHSMLNIKINTEAQRINIVKEFEYSIKMTQKKIISLVTGDLQKLRNKADIWVNSENTNMQMARHFDHSISGVIRYLGAKKGKAHQVVEDTIAKELAEIVGDTPAVTPASVFATGSGSLAATHGVKQILHTASVVGQVGEGYRPIHAIEKCVYNCLEKADENEFENLGCKSILFPLMGTGTGRGDVALMTKKLINEAIGYLSENPASRIEKVMFLAGTDRALESCQQVLQETPEVEIYTSGQ